MEVNRKGNELTIVLSSEEEALGLYAYLSGTIHEVPQETAAKGAWIYGWFFSAVQKLAHNFIQEKSIATMSRETAELPVSSQSTSKKQRKR